MPQELGVIEIDLFSDDVDSPDHPEVKRFRDLLEDVAGEYQSRILSFDIDKGTVSFSFDNAELMAEILNILQDDKKS